MLIGNKKVYAAASGFGVRRRSKIAALLLLAGAALHALPAAALDNEEAGHVVAILEKLVTETGSTVYYDEEAAEEWFQIDDESSRLIPAAGFSRTAWKTAFDQTMTGFIAAIPQSELEQMMEDFINQFGEVAKMTPQQKEEAANLLGAQMGQFDEIRARGSPYRDVVRPYAQRLKKIALR